MIVDTFLEYKFCVDRFVCGGLGVSLVYVVPCKLIHQHRSLSLISHQDVDDLRAEHPGWMYVNTFMGLPK